MPDAVLNAFVANPRWTTVADVKESSTPAARWDEVFLARHGQEVLAVLVRADRGYDAGVEAEKEAKKRATAEGREKKKLAEQEAKARAAEVKRLASEREKAEKVAEQARVRMLQRIAKDREKAVAKEEKRVAKVWTRCVNYIHIPREKVLKGMRHRLRVVKKETNKVFEEHRKQIPSEEARHQALTGQRIASDNSHGFSFPATTTTLTTATTTPPPAARHRAAEVGQSSLLTLMIELTSSYTSTTC